MDFMGQVDKYCERTDFSFFAEPFNLFSNFAFLLSAYLIFRRARGTDLLKQSAILLLLCLLVLVGISSALFHSFATGWAEIADVASIGLFVLVFLWYWLRQIIQLNIWQIFGIFLGFLVLTVSLQLVFQDLSVNASEGYFGLEIFLLGLGLHQRRRLAGSSSLLLAGFVFAITLVLRTLDAAFCARFPWGTHMFWHIGSAMVCFLVMKGMLEEQHRHALGRRPKQS